MKIVKIPQNFPRNFEFLAHNFCFYVRVILTFLTRILQGVINRPICKSRPNRTINSSIICQNKPNRTINRPICKSRPNRSINKPICQSRPFRTMA